MDVNVQALQGSVVAPVEGRRVPHLLYRRLAVSVGDCDAAAAFARARRALSSSRGLEVKPSLCFALQAMVTEQTQLLSGDPNPTPNPTPKVRANPTTHSFVMLGEAYMKINEADKAIAKAMRSAEAAAAAELRQADAMLASAVIEPQQSADVKSKRQKKDD